MMLIQNYKKVMIQKVNNFLLNKFKCILIDPIRSGSSKECKFDRKTP